MNTLNLSISWITFSELLIALILGSAVGLERAMAGKTAGMRTFGLVSLGACFFVLIMGSASTGPNAILFDQMRVLAGLVVGIGFLGGGTILHNHDHTSGLTTAAGLWVSAAIGAAVGYGLIALAVVATVMTLLVFTAFYFIEHKVFHAENE